MPQWFLVLLCSFLCLAQTCTKTSSCWDVSRKNDSCCHKGGSCGVNGAWCDNPDCLCDCWDPTKPVCGTVVYCDGTYGIPRGARPKSNCTARDPVNNTCTLECLPGLTYVSGSPDRVCRLNRTGAYPPSDFLCDDIDECVTNPTICGESGRYTCSNAGGGYDCLCVNPYSECRNCSCPSGGYFCTPSGSCALNPVSLDLGVFVHENGSTDFFVVFNYSGLNASAPTLPPNNFQYEWYLNGSRESSTVNWTATNLTIPISDLPAGSVEVSVNVTTAGRIFHQEISKIWNFNIHIANFVINKHSTTLNANSDLRLNITFEADVRSALYNYEWTCDNTKPSFDTLSKNERALVVPRPIINYFSSPFTCTITVSEGASSNNSSTELISIEGSPPQVFIFSNASGGIQNHDTLRLRAQARSTLSPPTDPSQLQYRWTELNENVFSSSDSTVDILIGSEFILHQNYTFQVTVTDAGYYVTNASFSILITLATCSIYSESNLTSPTGCSCVEGFGGDGLICEPRTIVGCSPFATLTSTGCTCNPGYTGNGTVCISEPTSPPVQVKLSIDSDAIQNRTQFITLFTQDITHALNTSTDRVQIVDLINQPNGTTIVVVNILPPTDTNDNRSSTQLASDLYNQVFYPQSDLRNTETGNKLKPFFQYSLLAYTVNQLLTKLEVWQICVIILTLVFLIVFVFAVNKYYFSNAYSIRLLTIMATTVTFATNVYFTHVLWLRGDLEGDPYSWEFILALCALVVPGVLNLGIVKYLFAMETRKRVEFGNWVVNHRCGFTVVYLFTALSTRNARILSSEVFGWQITSAPVSPHRELQFSYFGIVSNLLGDIPMAFVQVYISIVIDNFHTGALISLVFTSLNLLISVVDRVYSFRSYKRMKAQSKLQKMGSSSQNLPPSRRSGGGDVELVSVDYLRRQTAMKKPSGIGAA